MAHQLDLAELSSNMLDSKLLRLGAPSYDLSKFAKTESPVFSAWQVDRYGVIAALTGVPMYTGARSVSKIAQYQK